MSSSSFRIEVSLLAIHFFMRSTLTFSISTFWLNSGGNLVARRRFWSTLRAIVLAIERRPRREVLLTVGGESESVVTVAKAELRFTRRQLGGDFRPRLRQSVRVFDASSNYHFWYCKLDTIYAYSSRLQNIAANLRVSCWSLYCFFVSNCLSIIR